MCTSGKTLVKTEAAPFVPAQPSLTGSPPCDACASDAAASTASHPNVRDDRDTPLVREETTAIKR